MSEANRGLWQQVAAEAGRSASFRQRLVADPGGVLKEYGLEMPEGGLDQILAAGADGVLSDDDFGAIAGGKALAGHIPPPKYP
jgi:hypothetical protein